MTLSWNMQKTAEALDNANNGGSTDSQFLKIPKGDSFWHILPPLTSDQAPFYEARVHFIKDEAGKNYVYKCSKFVTGRCPMCNAAVRMQASEDKEEKDRGFGLRQQKRFLYNAVNTRTMEKGIMTVGVMLQKEILQELLEDSRLSGKDPCAYTDGMDLRITRTGNGQFDTRYRARSVGRHTLPPEMEQDHKQLPDLSRLYEDYTDAELELVLRGNFDPRGTRAKRALGAGEQQAHLPPAQPAMTYGQPQPVAYAQPAPVGYTQPVAPAQPMPAGYGVPAAQPVQPVHMAQPQVQVSVPENANKTPDLNDVLKTLGVNQ